MKVAASEKHPTISSNPMWHVKPLHLFTLLCLTTAIAGCDNGSTLQPLGGNTATGDNTGGENGIETVDFFAMETTDSPTVPYEPGLGFAVPVRGPLSLSTALIGSNVTGTEYRQDCLDGQVLAGIEGFASNNQVSQITVYHCSKRWKLV